MHGPLIKESGADNLVDIFVNLKNYITAIQEMLWMEHERRWIHV